MKVDRKTWFYGILLLAVLVFPLIVPNQYYMQILILVFIWSIAVYGLNTITGLTGQLSLAHAGFFAIGAYSLGLLTVKGGVPFWIAFILAIVFTAIISLGIGLVALRTKSHFFAIYTMSVGFMIYLLIYKSDLTGGVRGLIGIPNPSPIGPISFESMISYYYLMLFFLLLTIFIMYRLFHSLLGKTFMAIRNSEELAQTLGISVMKNKLLAFVLSAAFAALAGALYASYVRFIGPQMADIHVAFEILLYLLVGGIGTLAGPVVGTFIVVVLTQMLQFLEEFRMLVFGPIVVLLVLFYPRGLVGGYLMWKAKRKHKKQATQKSLEGGSARAIND
ncbi:branched-chain amino acid ABC transporter permease [Halalkalibacter akibai]|uniref:Branched-chain amino acid transport system permease protein LivM n=1 Tax=Halalkalibacter akibai (strain ATCC 43226 / DSM 21942 / CIP 109018 / JCM 9157 / 1139) TaxID=1236973 RepID=W4QMR8_HALA3|nr:branched-chain amino acid ABC transporter permease [Halalkalibacter akibai]GAE33386.1 branched-chain amino acid transport system permease protein LivM [Halalkalibacter akibai JCM 9157]